MNMNRTMWMAQAESMGIPADTAARQWDIKMNVPSDSALATPPSYDVVAEILKLFR